MLLAIFGFIKSPIGKYLMIGLLAAGLFFGLRAHFIHQGNLEGKQEASASFSDTLQKQQVVDRQAAADHIAADNLKDQAINSRLNLDAAALQSANQAFTALVKSRDAALASVNGLKDGELHPFIVKTLGIRPAGDATPGYLPTEERAIATAVVDDPACRAESQKLNDKIKALSDSVDQLNQRMNVAQDKFQALGDYTTTLERNYATLYNAFPRKGPRTWYSLGLLRGKAKPMLVPDPSSLVNPTKEVK